MSVLVKKRSFFKKNYRLKTEYINHTQLVRYRDIIHLRDFVLPVAFQTVRVTVYVPAVVYLCDGFLRVAVPPSPKVQAQEVGELVEVSVNVTVSGFVPEVGEAMKSASRIDRNVIRSGQGIVAGGVRCLQRYGVSSSGCVLVRRVLERGSSTIAKGPGP